MKRILIVSGLLLASVATLAIIVTSFYTFGDETSHAEKSEYSSSESMNTIEIIDVSASFQTTSRDSGAIEKEISATEITTSNIDKPDRQSDEKEIYYMQHLDGTIEEMVGYKGWGISLPAGYWEGNLFILLDPDNLPTEETQADSELPWGIGKRWETEEQYHKEMEHFNDPNREPLLHETEHPRWQEIWGEQTSSQTREKE